jgi:hypothetical protein
MGMGKVGSGEGKNEEVGASSWRHFEAQCKQLQGKNSTSVSKGQVFCSEWSKMRVEWSWGRVERRRKEGNQKKVINPRTLGTKGAPGTSSPTTKGLPSHP